MEKDIKFDTIESIEIIEDYAQKYVYDYSVKDNETFLLANGMFLHNTLNSVFYNEEIVVRKNKREIVVMKIGDFIENTTRSYDKQYQEYYEKGDQTLVWVNKQNENYKILTVNEFGKVYWEEIEAVTKHLPLNNGVVDNLLKVTTCSGREVIATKGESFLTYDEEKIVTIRGDELSINTELPLMNSFKVKFLDELYTYNITHLFSKNKNFLNKEMVLDNDFGFFIGVYLAEGYLHENVISISNNNIEIRERVYKFCDKFNIKYHTCHFYCFNNKFVSLGFDGEKITNVTSIVASIIKPSNKNEGISTYITIHSRLLIKLIQDLCGTGCSDKKIPDFSYIANEKFIKGIIDGYISVNGCVKKNGMVYYTTVSKNMVNGIELLLKRFGIVGKIYKGQSYNICLNRNNSILFYKHFTLTEVKKQERLNLNKNIRFKNNTLNNTTKDRIVKIEEYKSEYKYVYDLTVKNTRNFVLFNGICCRDTFHMAGVSSKSNINMGVPRLGELMSITKNPKVPSLSIYLDGDINTKDKALIVLASIQKVSFDYFVKSTKILFDPNVYNFESNIEEDNEFVKDYYEFYKLFFDMENISMLSPWLLRVEIHPLYLINKKITMMELTKKIKNYIFPLFNKSRINIIYSNENSQNIIFHIRLIYDDINKKIDEDLYVTNGDIDKLKEIENVLMNNFIIKGNRNINNSYLREIKDKYIRKTDSSIQTRTRYVIDTNGTDLGGIIKYKSVNAEKTISNHIHEVYDTFGIEVAREVLCNEIKNIVKHNGIYINVRHINLLCDLMTHKGILNSIDRHGINRADSGPLTKTSFEEAESQLSSASIFSQQDRMNSITSNLIMGQVGKYGTGFCEVIFDDTAFD